MKRFHQRPFRHHQKGVVAIIVGLCIFVLIGFLGLVVDLGRLFITKTELQNAADACALSAARELNGQSDALTRADNAGITVGTRNKVNFQKDAVEVLTSYIDYSNTLAGPYQTSDVANPATAKYARCTLPESGIAPYFMQVLGFGNQTVRAMGVAHLGNAQLGCAIPLGMCRQEPSPRPSPPFASDYNFGFEIGRWYKSKFPPGGDPVTGAKFTGSFDWIDFTPPGGGASELANQLRGTGVCNIDIPEAGTQVGEQGQMASLSDAWNARFGLSTNAKPDPAQSDKTGFSYTATTWPYGYSSGVSEPENAYGRVTGDTAYPNYKDAASRHLGYQGSDPNNLGNSIKMISDYATGTSTDRRITMAPIVDCDAWASSNPQQVSVLGYACILMLHPIKGPDNDIFIEYRGRPGQAGVPCTTTGLAGGNSNGPLVPVLVQ